jgi:hypothetical protein
VIDPIRRILDRPLAPAQARAVLALAACVTFGFATLVCLGEVSGSTPGDSGPGPRSKAPTEPPPAPPTKPSSAPAGSTVAPSESTLPEQDPQDRPGTLAYRRARRELREHRALQRLPFRGRGLSITLVGADHGRALIRIVAATIVKAKRGWRQFLRRWSDHGSAYEPRFAARSNRRHAILTPPGLGTGSVRRWRTNP